MLDPLAVGFLPSSLHTGVPEMDSQHEALFGRLVYLKNLCLGQNSLPAAEAEGLLDFLREHYATEAQLAMDMNIDFSGHAEQHRVMLQGVGKALGDAVEGCADVFGVLRYIEYWFERHIAHEDMPLSVSLIKG